MIDEKKLAQLLRDEADRLYFYSDYPAAFQVADSFENLARKVEEGE